MSGKQLLQKAMKTQPWNRRVDNGKRMNGVFGETDEKTKTIRINKKLHAVKNGGHLIKNPDGTEKMIGTIEHEELHARHPKMHEKTVRKLAKQRVKKLSKRTKGRMYARFNNKKK